MPTTTRPTTFGYRTAINGSVSEAEIRAWFEDVKQAVGAKASFGQLVDLRGRKAYSDAVNAVIEESMKWVRSKGMQRSAVILEDAVTLMQIKRLAKEAGMYEYERYFNATTDPQWERHALDWIEQGVDPDAK